MKSMTIALATLVFLGGVVGCVSADVMKPSVRIPRGSTA